MEIVLLRQTLFWAWMVTGAGAIYYLSLGAAIGWAAYTLAVFGLVLATACRNCHYCGKRCDTGLGLVAGMLFPSGGKNPAKFARAAKMTLPLLILSMLGPPAAVVFMLAKVEFTLLLLIWGLTNLMALFLFLLTTPLVACPRCAMREDCPLGGGKGKQDEGGKSEEAAGG